MNPTEIRLEAPPPLDPKYYFIIRTPDDDVNLGTELAVGALWRGMAKKAGIHVPTVSGFSSYPYWVHPYDNFWINRVSCYFFPRESIEWPVRLFAAYQAPTGEIGGGVYDIPESEWTEDWVDAGGPEKWQPWIARPIASHVAEMSKEPGKVRYGIYVRDHLFVLQVFDQWMACGSLPFLIEMYAHCRQSLKYLEGLHDTDQNGLIETACILSDLVVAGDTDINSTERAEDQVMLYGALQAFAAMARYLGSDGDAAWAGAWATRVKDGLNVLFWRPEGRYIFGIDRASRVPRLEYVTTTFANGYAILFGITSPGQDNTILDFMGRQDFAVPGPYHIPPVRLEDGPQNPPGVYCNGGCGWGRGIMPSVALACYARGRPDQGFDYLKRQGAAARKAGSFHEYWTWEKFTGETKAGGAPWYGETSAGFLDVLLHGTFGISPVTPGYTTLRVSPQFPAPWQEAKLDMYIPGDRRITIEYSKEPGHAWLHVDVTGGGRASVDLALPWSADTMPGIGGDNLENARLERGRDNGWRGVARIRGAGTLHLEAC